MTFFATSSIRRKLLAAFAVDLVLMALLGYFALHRMGMMDAEATQVSERVIPSMRNVDAIQDLVVRYHQHQLEALLYTSTGDRERLLGRMRQMEEEMAERFTEHEQHLADAEERAAFFELRRRWDAYVAANYRDYLPSTRRVATGSTQPGLSRLNPAYERLSNAAETLGRLDEEAAREAMDVVGDAYEQARTLLVVGTLLALVVSAAVGLLLAATLGQRIRRLTRATRRVAAGDLEAHVEDPAGDELSHLARHFDHMVVSLREQRAALETRHRELRASLDEQRRLTEDLMRRKETEEAALRARAEAEARDSAKSLFLATMSHELRTPLNAILGYAQILGLESRVRGEARMEEDLGRIDSAGKHLLTLIDNILDFSKIEQGKMELEIVEVDLVELARGVVELVSPLAREKHNLLRYEPTEGVGRIRSDPAKLRQILFNLLSNAVKFTDHGEVVLEVARHPDDETGGRRGDPRSERVELVVRDTGIGIRADRLEQIFEPFRQAESSITRRFGGTGLGLVVSRQLCEMLGGSIEVESELDVGSTFRVHLPLEPPGRTFESRGSGSFVLPSSLPDSAPGSTDAL